jgi:NADH:ubiquinone oxidoreductase subunit 2 (subunit N)
MDSTSGYCRSCYRDVPEDSLLCRECAERRTPASRASRVVLLLGLAGLPVMFAGILGFNGRLSIIGAAISGTAVLLHVALTLR